MYGSVNVPEVSAPEIKAALEEKAAASHTHGAGDINSGTLAADRLPTVPVTKGGTGATTASAARTNLGAAAESHGLHVEFSTLTPKTNSTGTAGPGSATTVARSDHVHPTDTTRAAASHTHGASDIDYGTLGTERLPTVPVTKGGTGKTTVTNGSYLVGNGTSALQEKTASQVLSDIGAAAASHTHTASDVGAAASGHSHTLTDLSGALSIAKGGTGATTASAALTALGAAAASHTHTASDVGAAASGHNHTITDLNGTLTIAKGGTGATTASAALSNLGAAASSHTHAAGDVTSGTFSTARLPTVPVSKGGTGATTAAAARTALSVPSVDEMTTAINAAVGSAIAAGY